MVRPVLTGDVVWPAYVGRSDHCQRCTHPLMARGMRERLDGSTASRASQQEPARIRTRYQTVPLFCKSPAAHIH